MLTQPLFLIGLAAIAIPIAIHLLQLRRYRKVYFSNVDMLEELQSENRRQRNLRQLLILATRILSIVFIVLAFCQPVIPHKGSQIQKGGTAVSVYIDNSYSMECGGMEGSLIEAAKQKALEIADAYDPSVPFQLLTNNASGSQFRWLSREDFISAVREVEAGAVTTPLSQIAIRQQEFLRSSPASNRHAYLISDFQRTTADLATLPADTAVLSTLIPLGGSSLANVYIDSLAFNSPAYFRGSTVHVEARVRNGGDKAVEKQPLRLYIGDRQRAVTSLDIAPHSSATASLTFTIQDDTLLLGHVETTDYPVTFDDRLYFALPVATRIPLLVVSGKSENPFIKKLFAGDSLTQYRQEPYDRMDYSHIEQSRVVILDELHAIPSGLAQALVQFVDDGGTLVVVPAPDAEVSSYNLLLSSLHAPLLQAWRQKETRAGALQSTHPLYSGVFRNLSDEVEMPSTTGHYTLQQPGGTVTRQVIGLLDGNSLLSETPFGQGHLYLLATPLRPDYTDFVHQALFVPTLYNMALFSTPLPQPYHLITATQPIPLSTLLTDDSPRHLDPVDATSGQQGFIPDIRRSGSHSLIYPHGEIVQAGNYILSPQPLEGLAFNYSRQESDLACLSRSDIKRLVNEAGLSSYRLSPPAAKSMTDYIRSRNQGTPLWRWCILLALLALLAETLLIRLPLRKSKA